MGGGTEGQQINPCVDVFTYLESVVMKSAVLSSHLCVINSRNEVDTACIHRGAIHHHLQQESGERKKLRGFM